MNITQEQLNTAVQEALKGVLSQGLPAIPDETRKFKDFGNAFMKDKRRRVAKTTYSTYKRIYDKHILPAFENHPLASITRAQVQQFINDMDDEDYSMETMKKTKCLLSSMLELAFSDRLIPVNPCKAVKLPKKAKNRKRPPTMDEYKRLLAACRGHRLWIAVPLLFLAGLRIGEMLALTWEDIDMEERLIHVSKTYSVESGSGRAYLKYSPKTEAGIRYIPIFPELYDMLKEYREENDASASVVLASTRGEYTHPQVFRSKIFNLWCYAAELPEDITPHSGRHYFAYQLLSAGMNPEVLRQLTGHSDMSTLLNVYCQTNKLSDKDLVQARSFMSVLCG